jgi:L-rhamnose isomerase
MNISDPETINQIYLYAKKRYKELDVDTDAALKKLGSIPVSVNCWQGDDLAGFEHASQRTADGGIMSTGDHPGRARSGDELRQDLDIALDLIPGNNKVNLHAIYAETNGIKTERDELDTIHFRKWIDWAKRKKIGIDFNPSFFSHAKAGSGFTLSDTDPDIRGFWTEHAKRSRKIAADIGKELGQVCINNIWIPDGSKDITVNRFMHRKLLKGSLDRIFDDKYDGGCLLDCVESKLFGIGSESFTVGSHEFYMGYTGSRNDVSLCFDMGHFHPTEGIADKISSVMVFQKSLLIHVSRPVRWDSDHVPLLGDDLLSVAAEVVRAGVIDRTHFAVDFFDGSINRITAWIIGVRNTQKALLSALLEPLGMIRDAEMAGNMGNRLALLEECRTMPFSAVWDKFCMDEGTAIGTGWLDTVNEYENKIIRERTSEGIV